MATIGLELKWKGTETGIGKEQNETKRKTGNFTVMHIEWEGRALGGREQLVYKKTASDIYTLECKMHFMNLNKVK